jgi:hypothetical protein
MSKPPAPSRQAEVGVRQHQERPWRRPDVWPVLTPEMVRCFDPGIEHNYEIWLLTHERLRTVPRVCSARFTPAARQIAGKV